MYPLSAGFVYCILRKMNLLFYASVPDIISDLHSSVKKNTLHFPWKVQSGNY